jgi:glycosyltransferase involved in cell wall biosynthesis
MNSYNYGQYLPESIQAIVDQSYQPSEFIIVDDCSTDNSVEIIEGFAKKYPYIRFIRNETNQGALNAFYKGFELLTGDYLLIAAADDKILPGLFEKSGKLLAQHPSAGLCTCLSYLIDEFGNRLPSPIEKPLVSNSPCYLSPEKALALFIERGNWVVPYGTFWNAKAIKETDAFTRESKDYIDGFAAALLPLAYGACYIPEPLAQLRLHGHNQSSSYRQDPKVWMELVRPMENLMGTSFVDKFPPSFVKDLKKRNRYVGGVMALSQLDQACQETLENINNSLQNRSIVDRTTLLGIRFSSKMLHFIIRLYLFLRFRRVNKYLFFNTMYRLKNKLLGKPK